MLRFVGLSAVMLLLPSSLQAQTPGKPLASDLKNPVAAAAGPDGKVYVCVTGESGKEAGGAVVVLDQGKTVTLAADLDSPRAMVAFQKWLFIAGKNQVWRIDTKGKTDVFVATDDFPTPPINFTGLALDIETGTLLVADSGDAEGKGAAVYRIAPKLKMPKSGLNISVAIDQKRWPELKQPAGIVLDGQNHLLVLDSATGKLHRVQLVDGTAELLTEGLASPEGITWDQHGRLYIGEKGGQVLVIPRPGQKPVSITKSFQSPGMIALGPNGKSILVPDTKAGTLTALPAQVPGAEVDETPLNFEAAPAFTSLKWTGWQSVDDKGKPFALRPLVLTHAGDGSNRIFVAIQQGIIHTFPSDPKAASTKVFLDIHEKVVYKDNENEEGLLGLAFHPRYKKNGEFFVFYTLQTGVKNKHINIVSRFKVSKDDPDRADPASEEELLRIEHPSWNHDGGTICFGPDGYLYIATGDGGLANDPFNNGQNLKSLLAKVLRIDVDHKDGDKKYAIPKDNPFVGRDDALPETWAYGLRNIWRMSFDRKTGALWAGDVGQNLYEEIDIIVKGGNYGWKLREGLHPFGPKGSGPRKDLIDPIWEYHHSVGVCIIGGHVYRGKALPELDGAYIYADYISGKIWGLRYDDSAGRVVANRPIRTPGLPVLTFGEDEAGEVYFLTHSLTGKGIYQIQAAR
jgi:glucose/arabinose dehydrogenase